MMAINLSREVELVSLRSGTHRVGDSCFGGCQLTACGRAIGGGTETHRGLLEHVTCIECLVGAGVPRKQAQQVAATEAAARAKWEGLPCAPD
ncbi:MAG TPA: hypothetical protein VHY20_11365 [Pirellulales bacterium]|jgi:hypothetical protein|nr:hypothetical protein [Pirellulales bacterium]